MRKFIVLMFMPLFLASACASSARTPVVRSAVPCVKQVKHECEPGTSREVCEQQARLAAQAVTSPFCSEIEQPAESKEDTGGFTAGCLIGGLTLGVAGALMGWGLVAHPRHEREDGTIVKSNEPQMAAGFGGGGLAGGCGIGGLIQRYVVKK